MTISTIKGNPFSRLVIVYNTIMFCLFKITIFSNLNTFRVREILLIILLSIVANIIYILMINKLLKFYDTSTIKKYSYYSSDLECNLFYDYDTNYIFELSEDSCNVYINQDIVLLIALGVEIESYIDELKDRILSLSIVDKFLIYAYKYSSITLLTIGAFSFWQIASCMIIKDTFVGNFILFGTLIVIWGVIVILYYFIDKYLSIFIEWVMIKRKLLFFIYG